MSSLPFEVHEVLEQEYVSMYGPIDVPLPDYTKDDIIDEPWARAILLRCGIDAPGEIVAVLNVLIAARDLKRLLDSPAITDNGRDLIDRYDVYTDGVTDGRRREINRAIVDDAFLGAVKRHRDIRLEALYAKLHAKSDAEARTALCISGGGIRTATFALGVIQGLAGARILDKFDYLSTVSGGGYIGSWLSSWVRRHPQGIEGVQQDLVRGDTAVEGTKAYVPKPDPLNPPPSVDKDDFPKKKIDPEPRPLRHLRAYSNYLSPKLGFLSGDTWTMASLYIRNLLLNLLVLIPLLAAALAVPRLFALLLRADVQFSPPWLLAITVAALAIGFGYLGLSRPTVHGRHAGAMSVRGSAGFLTFHVVPLIVAATTLSLYWAKIAGDSFRTTAARDGWYYVAAAVVMTFLPAGIYYFRFFVQSSAAERREPLQRQHGVMKKLGAELMATIVSLFTLLALL